MNPKNTEGKKIGLLVWSKDNNGADDVRVFTGIAKWHDDKLYLKRIEGLMLLPDEWIEKIKPVGKDLQDTLLNSEYYISLTIENLPEKEDISKLIKLPINWNNAT
jgi:hypothetical protein